MKFFIYGIILVLCIITVVSVLVLYYTQDATATYTVKNSISINDIQTTTNQQGGWWNGSQYVYSGEHYIGNIQASIGNVEIENNGIFTQVEPLKIYVVCPDFKESSYSSGYVNYDYPMTVWYETVESNVDPNSLSASYRVYSGYSNQQTIEVPVGGKKSAIIKITFTPNNLLVSQLSNLKGTKLDVFELPVQEQNPFGGGYDSSMISRTYNTCEAIKAKLSSVKTIAVI